MFVAQCTSILALQSYWVYSEAKQAFIKSEYLGNVGLIIDLDREFMTLEFGIPEAGNYLRLSYKIIACLRVPRFQRHEFPMKVNN